MYFIELHVQKNVKNNNFCLKYLFRLLLRSAEGSIEKVINNISFIGFWHILLDGKSMITLKTLVTNYSYSLSCLMKRLYSNCLYIC